MVLNIDGFARRWQSPSPIRWLDRLHAYWDEQRADAAMPDADELFLADLVEIMPYLLLGYHDDWRDAFRVEFVGQAVTVLLGAETVDRYPEEADPGDILAWLGDGYASVRQLSAPGAVRSHHGSLQAPHLPYARADGRVSLILSGVVPWQPPHADSTGRVSTDPLAGVRIRR